MFSAVIYTIEFQKRGLPHAHILLFLGNANKLSTPQEIDDVISAELPDKEINPALFDAVSNFMVHGPCGLANKNSPCMKDGKCSKYFPKNYTPETFIHEDGYVRYRRRDDGREVLKSGVPLDNRSVIPYNPYLLLKYQAHINVERCKQGESIKYLFKYVSKGHDRATAAFYADSEISGPDVVHDEIKMYYDVRYLSPCEAIWRIIGHDINYRYPSVERLAFHLPNQQNVIYEDDDDIEEVVSRATVRQSMFLAWMAANDEFDEAKLLTYAEFPTKFVFKKHLQQWTPRKTGFSIGRLYYVPPGIGESFYLRLLLTAVRGPKSYKELRTVDGVEYNNFRDACYALGLLEDDREYIDAFREVGGWATPDYIRRLFCTLLFCNAFGRPEIVWQQSWRLMSDDVLYRYEQDTGLILTDTELENAVLVDIERLLNLNGRSLNEYESLPFPSSTSYHGRENRYMYDESNFDFETMRSELPRLVAKLTNEQKEIYDVVRSAVNMANGGFFFVYGHGGTGKTYLWKTLSSSLRGDGRIVLTVASSGIAALLLPRGKTAQSQFAIPLSINEDSVCNIKQGSHLAELLIHTSLIIWDEAPMANKLCFKALDRTLKDICHRVHPDASEMPFGGKVVVLGGDFRQILPVIPRGCRQDIVMATINASYLWEHCRVFKLTKNMRLIHSDVAENDMDVIEFADWVLAIGEGSVPTVDGTTNLITIPDEYLLHPTSSPLECIVQSTYPELLEHLGDSDYFKDRAILASSLTVVEEVNNYIIDSLPGDKRIYLSTDSVSRQDVLNDSLAAMHSVEFLNMISMSGVPNHQLRLKVGCPIMLMRNLDKSIGLCNGTRLIVTRLERHVIQAKIMTGDNVGLKVLIPRITLSPSDTSLPFTLCRRQFPIMPSFAMTINKSQGQSLMSVGIYLPRPVFTHGQLYVAVSRVRHRHGLKMLLLDNADQVTNRTANVVYNEVFCNVVD